ncbi:MAG: iron-containing alcohol dehydrogenase, partial [Verrucomicrobiota bacterium]
EAIREMSAAVGAPAKLYDVGVTADRITDMARDAMKSSHVAANPRSMDEAEVAEVYRQAM